MRRRGIRLLSYAELADVRPVDSVMRLGLGFGEGVLGNTLYGICL